MLRHRLSFLPDDACPRSPAFLTNLAQSRECRRRPNVCNGSEAATPLMTEMGGNADISAGHLKVTFAPTRSRTRRGRNAARGGLPGRLADLGQCRSFVHHRERV